MTVLVVLLLAVARRARSGRTPATRASRLAGRALAPRRVRTRRADSERHGHRRRPQRGGGDRAARREPARARLPAPTGSRSSSPRTPRPTAPTSSRQRPARGSIRNPRGGKVAAQDRAVRETASEIVAFSDANATWEPDALRELVAPVRRPGRRLRLRAAPARGGRRLEPRGPLLALRDGACARPSRGSARSPAATARSTRVRRSDYVEVDPRFGHDLSLPYLMVQRGRRAVYEPAALASEKPTPSNESEYRRKVRMFEHCWLIVLRGRMLRRLGAALHARRSLSHRLLRYALGAAPPRAARDLDRARRRTAGSTTSCSRRSSRCSLAALAGVVDRPLLRARSRWATRGRARATTCGAACPRPGASPRGRAEPRARRRRRRRRRS